MYITSSEKSEPFYTREAEDTFQTEEEVEHLYALGLQAECMVAALLFMKTRKL